MVFIFTQWGCRRGDWCPLCEQPHAGGHELAKAAGRTISMGWTLSIPWGPRSGVKRRRHLRLGFESGVGVH